MLEKTVSKRWASALLLLAEKEEKVESIESQLLVMKDVFLKDNNFRTLLTHPKIQKSIKKNVLKKLIEPGILLSFFELIIDKGRASLIPHMADAFDELADRSKGVVRVNVKSYSPLSDEVKSELIKNVSKIIGDKQVKLNVEVDRSLMGGLWVKVGDNLLDGSVLTKYSLLKEKLYRRL